ISLDTGPRTGGDDFSRKPKRDFGPRDASPRDASPREGGGRDFGSKEGGRDKPRFGERDGKKTSFRPKKTD
ncbi:MAG: ATP-dependent helicase, partial [Cellvibrio sp.]|nr:ATP-dependent helicase [Cellvibrio sp.]